MQNITPLSPHSHPSPPLQISRSHSGNNESHVRARAISAHAVIAAGEGAYALLKLENSYLLEENEIGRIMSDGRKKYLAAKWIANTLESAFVTLMAKASRDICLCYRVLTVKARRFTSSSLVYVQEITETARHFKQRYIFMMFSLEKNARKKKPKASLREAMLAIQPFASEYLKFYTCRFLKNNNYS